MLWLFLAMQLPIGIIAGKWLKRRAARYFDSIEAEP